MRLRRLSRRRSSRREEGRYLIDGPVLLAEALEAGVGLEAVYAEPDADHVLLERVSSAGVEVVPVADAALKKVLDLVNPRSVVAVALQRKAALEEVLAAAGADLGPVLALVGLQDPGNAGTLIRVAEASGCVGVVLTDGSVDAWNPKVVRASAGSVLRVALCDAVALADLLAGISEHGLETIVTVAGGGAPPETTPMSGGCVVIVGSESSGVPSEVAEAATSPVTIPMAGSVESLNAAVAGALVLFEAARQRRDARDLRRPGRSMRNAFRSDGLDGPQCSPKRGTAMNDPGTKGAELVAELSKLGDDALGAIDAAADSEALAALDSRFLGKKSRISELKASLASSNLRTERPWVAHSTR